MADPTAQSTNQPDYKNRAYGSMSAAWQLCDHVAGGTSAMRSAGQAYLPKEEAERDNAYNRRLVRSVLFNAYSRTVGALVGMVFRNDPELSSDVSPEIKAHLENVDLAGTHIDVFAKELFTDSFDGHAFILVDMQPALQPGATRADELATGRRPYWVRYEASQALNWRIARIAGQLELTQITFEEKSSEPSGAFGEEEVIRYRVFRKDIATGIVSWELFRHKQDNGISTIESEATGLSQTPNGQSIKQIPVAVVYGNRVGVLVSEPPLLDLAHLNVAHYQEYSDYRNILHVANVPILVRKGATDEQQKIVISGNTLVDVPENGDLTYCEHDGKAIEGARQELMDLEQRIAMIGLSMLSQRSDSDITATEKRQDWIQESSELATMARSLQDGLELALQFHAEYLGQDKSGSIKLGVAEADLTLDGTTITALGNLVPTKLSLESFLAMLQRGFPGVDLRDELKRLQALGPGAMPSTTDLNKSRASWTRNAPPPAKELHQPPANQPANQ